MSSSFCTWIQVSSETPFQIWFEQFKADFKLPKNVVVEKWEGNEIHWAKLLDSLNTINLFGQKKIIIVSKADQGLKQASEISKLIERFLKGPHWVLLHSEQVCPSSCKTLNSWKFESTEEQKFNEKAAFQWIDSIHSEQLTPAINLLDEALSSGQHPLQLVQLLTRDFRIGRLIHHALSSRWSEAELMSRLKVPGFVIQKWGRRPKLSRSQWSLVFDRLLEADLDLKSGADGLWVLRKLTFDLVQLSQTKTRLAIRRVKRPLRSEPLLWTIVPSFA